MTNATMEKVNQAIYRFDEKEHLHFLNGIALTGTSSVMDVLGKNLVWWAAELAAVECLEAGEKIETIRQEYEEAAKSGNKKQAIDALQVKYPIFKKARFAHFTTKNKKAKEGTNLHEILERFCKAEMGKEVKALTAEETKLIQPFIDWSKQNVKRFLWSEGNCFSERLFIGGISDFGCELINGEYAVGDFKSAKEAYVSHFIQDCLYAIQIMENGVWTSDGTKNKRFDKPITKLIVIAFGSKNVVPEIRNCEDYKEGSECAVKLYRLVGLDERIKKNAKQ